MLKQKKHSDENHHYLNRDLVNLKGEIWKEVNEYEGLYEVSNFGRVKALPKLREVTITARRSISYWTKELILKQVKQKFLNTHVKDYTFCLSINLYKDGNYTSFMVSRLVYAHFGPDKPRLSRAILILHNDGDGLHNHIGNLYASGYTNMHKIAFSKKRKKSHFTGLRSTVRRSYTQKAVEVNKKVVTQYNQKGKKIRSHYSIVEATNKTGINESSISNAIYGRSLTAGGYIWRAGKGPSVINVRKFQKKIAERHKRMCKRIRQYSLTGQRIAEFSSIKEAAFSVKGSARQLSDAVNGRSKTAYKFIWKIIR